MAKTYLEACPIATMAIFDTAASVGGVWAKERLYPGLKTNNLLGTYEFSDFPMTPGKFGVDVGQHIPGEVVHNYLSQFAEHFDLQSRLCLQHKVLSAEQRDDGSWLLRARSADLQSSRIIITSKLVVATGLTSEPFMPQLGGQDKFEGPLFHAKELQHRAHEIQSSKYVAVLGGNKSAWDTCFFAAKSGAHVHLVMRPGGGGPSWVWPVLFSPFKVSIQRLAATRFFTWFDPCIWSEKTGPVGTIRSFLHGSFIGRKVVSGFWNLLQGFAYTEHRYDDNIETQKLKPWVNPFWMGNSLSIHNYTSSWLDLAREGKITVHVADVKSLSKGTMHLSNGEEVDIDALVCCTGWRTKPPIEFLPAEISSDLGLRGHSLSRKSLVTKAQADILTKLPSLRQTPTRTLPPGASDPIKGRPNFPKNELDRYVLYRFLVPGSKKFMERKNVAFIGSHLALNAIMIAQLQALWITAFFMDKIPNLEADTIDHGTVDYETVLHNEHTRTRHPHAAGGAGERCPDLAFDCLSYMDLLAGDLGLAKYRKLKGTGVWSELFHRYGPNDYIGVVQEWLNGRGKRLVDPQQ